MAKLKKGDRVIILCGKDKTRTGVISRIIKKTNRAIVEGVNLVKKHVKGNPQKNLPGGIVEKEASIHLSNLAIFNTTNNTKDKVIYKFKEDGTKYRAFKSTQEPVDV